MKYGCIGEKLGHSFSREVHGAIADYEYELCEIPREGLQSFMLAADFSAINVTIPYKEPVISYLDEIDSHAREIGAVNTVVKRGGRLYGYNTDFYGMCELFRHAGIDPRGRKAAILGTGGTAKTAAACLKALSASEILTVSRTPQGSAISYAELYADHSDTEIIINTTPVGMFPKNSDSPISLAKFPKLSGVIDAVYNPLRTTLISEARELGIAAEGGLYMLVAQGVRASEIFLGKKYPEDCKEKVYKRILASKENIVLTGMPSSGKSTLGKELSELLGLPFCDSDELIRERTGKEIPDIFRECGEAEFRRIEREVIADISKRTATVIATGGGVPLCPENVRALRQNGRIIFLDRALSELMPTKNRPLALDAEAIRRRYEERYETYCKTADLRIPVSGTARELAIRLKEMLFL